MGTAKRRGDSRLAWGEYHDYTEQNYGPYVAPTDPPSVAGASGVSTAATIFSGVAVLAVCAFSVRFVLKKISTDGSKYLGSKYLSPTEDEERPMKGKRGWGGFEDDEQPTRTSTPESSEHPAKVRDVPSALEKGDLPAKQRSPGKHAAPALPAEFPRGLRSKDDQKQPLVEDTRKSARRTKAAERSSTLGSLQAEALPTKASLDYEKLSVKELKQRLAAAGVRSTGAVEVSDLVELLRQHDAEQAEAQRPAPPALYPDGSPTRARKTGAESSGAKPAPPALFPDGSSTGAKLVSGSGPASENSSTSPKNSPSRSPKRDRRSGSTVASVKAATSGGSRRGGSADGRMPEKPPPLMGSPPRALPRHSAPGETASRLSSSEDGNSVISAGQISAPVSSKATSRGSGRNGARKERKVAPRPSDTGRTLADLM